MRKEYDFSKAKRNPYAKQLKRQVTMRLDEATIRYFKELAQGDGHSLSDAHQLVSERLCGEGAETDYALEASCIE